MKVPFPENDAERIAALRAYQIMDNLTPADVYFGCGQCTLDRREEIKRRTTQNRGLLHHRSSA